MSITNIITINNNAFSFQSGDTILSVAQRNNIEIPTLCHLKNTTPTGECNICVVEIKNSPDLATACNTPASNDMEVFTESPKVIDSRKDTIKSLLYSGHHNCAIRDFNAEDWTEFQLKVISDDNTDDLCPVWGDCELQNLAYKYQVTTKEEPPTESQYPAERANPFIIRDFSRCILCGRCVKACREIQVNNAIDFGYKKSDSKEITKIIAGDDVTLKDSECVFCGECVQACPVGALVPDKIFIKHRLTKAEKTRTTCSYCGVGCQMDVFTQNNKIIDIQGAEHDLPPNHSSLCVKGRFGFDFVASPERLTTPLIKKNGEFQEATWDEAFEFTASKLNSLKDEFGSESLGVLTSARITNEENYIAQKFARAVLKTNNVDHCARL
jgi:predicted molibdopterin-dependent oxidoreductase YjgC